MLGPLMPPKLVFSVCKNGRPEMRHVGQDGRNLTSVIRSVAAKLRPRTVVVVGPKTVQPKVVIDRGRIGWHMATGRCITNGRGPAENKIKEIEVGGPLRVQVADGDSENER